MANGRKHIHFVKLIVHFLRSQLTGTLMWKCILGKPLFSSPVVTKLGVIIGCVDGAVYCVSHLGQKVFVMRRFMS